MRQAQHAQLQRLMTEVRELRLEFRRLHAEGKAALKAKDYAALGVAIEHERRLIDRHRKLIERQQALLMT